MKRVSYHFELSEEELEARNLLAAQLLTRVEVQKFMEKYQCPESVIVENAGMFKRWCDRLIDAKSVTTEVIRADESKGHFLDLKYDASTGILSEYFVALPQLTEIKLEKEYLKKYLIMPLPKSLQDANFETIRFSEESPNYQKIASLMMKFTNDSEMGYYLYGDLGVGKTFLSACVTNYFAKKNDNVAFIHVPSFLSLIKESFSNDELRIDLSRLKRVKVLVLDDLGAEPITPWSRDEILLSILNDRYENKMKTIITSNVTPNQLVNLYKNDTRGSEDLIRARRLVDRILSLTNSYEISGDNRRLLHKKGN